MIPLRSAGASLTAFNTTVLFNFSMINFNRPTSIHNRFDVLTGGILFVCYYVISSLAPGLKVVTDYLAKAGLTDYLNQLGFNLVGYGCTTCIGNSGPLPAPIEEAIKKHDLTVGAMLSGNRNFEGRIHPLVKTNWLASSPLVVAYALVGNMQINLADEPLGQDKNGKDILLKDIWPTSQEIADAIQLVKSDMFHEEYNAVFHGDEAWQALDVKSSATYSWQPDSTYTRVSQFLKKKYKFKNKKN